MENQFYRFKEFFTLDNSNILNYAGLGSQETPSNVQDLMTETALYLSEKGYMLRSGGVSGADNAFEKGALEKEIFLPYQNFNRHKSHLYVLDPRCFEIAKTAHPSWHHCSEFSKMAHACNISKILGASLMDPVKFLICWTKDGATSEEGTSSQTGGSRIGIIIASRNNIPILNLRDVDSFNFLCDFISNYKKQSNKLTHQELPGSGDLNKIEKDGSSTIPRDAPKAPRNMFHSFRRKIIDK
jgi:hypothetical protein